MIRKKIRANVKKEIVGARPDARKALKKRPC